MGKEAVSSYRPSGKVSYILFLPLLFASLIVALLCAVILLIIDSFGFYFFIFAPLIVGLPVFGMVYVTFHFGKCRNYIVGMFTSLFLMSSFYVGYWMISYTVNVLIHGPETEAAMEKVAGCGGLPGYFVYRCKTNVLSDGIRDDKRAPRSSDSFGSFLLYGIEILLLLSFSITQGYKIPCRIFYEEEGQWASSIEYRFHAHDLPKILDAIRNNSWREFTRMVRLPKLGGDQGLSPMVKLKFEYLKNSVDAPVFLTLSGQNLGKDPAAKAEGVKGLKGLSNTFFKQHTIEPEHYPVITKIFSDIKIDVQPIESIDSSIPKSSGEIEDNSKDEPDFAKPETVDVPQIEYSTGFKGVLEKTGLIQPKVTGPDFREKAAEKSRLSIKAAGDMISPIDIDKSLCLQVDENETVNMTIISAYQGFTFWGNIMLFFVLFFGGLFTMAYGEDQTGQLKVIVMSAGGVLLVSSFVALFFALCWKRLRAPGRLLNRPNAFLDHTSGLKKMLLRLEDAATYHVNKRVPEDICCCLLDSKNQRLIMEGCNYRYLIKGKDVTCLEPMESGMVTSVRLSYNIGDENLTMVLYKADIGGAALNPLITMMMSKSFVKKLRKTLGIQ